ncbi:MAG: hypothetical protein V4549_18175 [Bacteroidota bacterium]
MKVLNISTEDYANFAHENAKALRSIGVDCEDVKTKLHPFNYATQSEIVSRNVLIWKIENADIVQMFHTDEELLKYCLNKKTIVYHTGSRYRSRPSYFNGVFNPFVNLSFTDQCEFVGLGAKNLHYIATAIDVKDVKKFGHESKQPYKIGHFPSNSEVKGTLKILEMLTKLDHEFNLNHSSEIVSHELQQKRMNDCDIYIELFKPELNGKPYGCFGVTAFEAAAAGKIVVTQNINEKAYENAYGGCPFIICNNEKDFIFKMNKLLSMSSFEISLLQTQTYEWVKEKHSYEATGEYLWSKLQAL